jgi:homoserine/homoserine lactone efflux protein
MAVHLYLAFVAACVVIVIVPGPTVTLIIANSLRHGTRAGMLNIAGSQLGFACMIAIVLAGLASLIDTMGV